MNIETNKKARQLCLDASIRPYCKKIYFFIEEIDRKEPENNQSNGFILQDAIACLLHLDKKFINPPVIDVKLVKYISRYEKKIKLTRKDGSRIVLHCEPISLHPKTWDSTRILMQNRYLAF